MSKQREKELSPTTIGLICLIVGSMTSTFTDLPVYPFLFNLLGAGSVVYGFTGKPNKHQKFFKDIGLCIDEKYPILIEEKDQPYGKLLKFKKPHAITSEDFRKKATGLNEYFGNGKGDVVVNFENGYIFMELHNKKLETMYDFRNLSEWELSTKGKLEIPIGKLFNGIFKLDIAKAPNVLIAGETGGGKSNLVNLIITYLLKYKAQNHNIKLYLMDFKNGVELNRYTNHPNVVSLSTTINEASEVLYEIEKEMNRRYEVCKNKDVKDVESYNKKYQKNQIPPIVIIIDELAEFYITKSKTIISQLELLMSRIRAANIHIVAATQRPDKDVVNGRIKVNMPTRICYKVADDTNSRIILDTGGAEKLRDSGNCLAKHKGDFLELQTFFIDENYSKQLIKDAITSNARKSSNFTSVNEGGNGVKFKTTPSPKENAKVIIPNAFLKLIGGDFLDEE